MMRLAVLCQVACWAVFALSARASAQDAGAPLMSFTQLMAAFERMPGLEAKFVEEKRLGLLAQPLESSGRLYFTRPGLFLRRVEKPRASEVVITPSEVRVRDDGHEQRIELSARPEVRPFVESLTWLLAGNEKQLRSVYTIAFAPATEGKSWTLTLTPKADPIAQLIAHIRVLGTGLSVSEIQVREKGGDEAITRIVEANPARKFSQDELRTLFGFEPKAPESGNGKRTP